MSILKSNLLLLLTAAIWGFAFVAQRVGMEHIGPFYFNGIRFMLGGLSLVPLILYRSRSIKASGGGSMNPLLPGLLAGLVLFIAASLQQVGIVETSAGKTAFITALYVVLVPIVGLFLKQSVGRGTWMGVGLALSGLYLLTIKEDISINHGDLLVLIGSLFWTAHILIIGRYSRKVDVLKLSSVQFITCSVLSLITALMLESFDVRDVQASLVPILYGGFFSVAIAYTLQTVAQKWAPPAHAAIILSMETVFAVIGGYLILGEIMRGQEILGCILMLSGMLVSQLGGLRNVSLSAKLNT